MNRWYDQGQGEKMNRELAALILSLFWGLYAFTLEMKNIKNFDQVLPASVFGLAAIFMCLYK
jgi:hypothetical protein